jgi:hypothetical protein
MWPEFQFLSVSPAGARNQYDMEIKCSVKTGETKLSFHTRINPHFKIKRELY